MSPTLGDQPESPHEARLAAAYRVYALLIELLDDHLGGDVMVTGADGSRLYILLVQSFEDLFSGLPLELQLELVDWQPFPTLRELTGDDADAWESLRPQYARILGLLEAASVRSGDRLDDTSNTVLTKMATAVRAYSRALAQEKEKTMQRLTEAVSRGPFSSVPMPVSSASSEPRDVFLSHASADKSWVRQLYEALTAAGITSWFDKAELAWGQDLRASIEWGLSASRIGIIVVSEAFADRPWTEAELSAVFNRHIRGVMQMLPIWHGVDGKWVADKYPLVAPIFALRSSDGIPAIVAAMAGKLESLEARPSSSPASPPTTSAVAMSAEPATGVPVSPQTEWELEVAPLLAAIQAWSKLPDRTTTLLAAHLLQQMGIDSGDQPSLRNLAEMLREGYISGPSGNNPLTGDGKVLDVAIRGLTEKGRLLLERIG